MTSPADLPVVDALVIGAGPAGVGTALALQAVDGMTYGPLDRGKIGQTFLDWPEWTRLLTPSFTGNAFGAIDLNAVHPETSPALLLQTDYPSGAAYAHYLRKVIEHFDVPVVEDCAATEVARTGDHFTVTTSRGPLGARNIIWAGGEHGAPLTPEIPGADLAVHTADKAAWEPGDHRDITVVGGYESGIDIACSLIARGHRVTVLDEGQPWERTGSDPSLTLSPRTRERLRLAQRREAIILVGGARAESVELAGGRYTVTDSTGAQWTTTARPVFATGFRPHLGPVEKLFDTREDGWPLLTGDDESTTTEGLFLTGPAVRHRHLHLCFIYKFRQRFAHVAGVIGGRLGHDTALLASWRKAGMLVEDVSCCDTACVC